MVGALAGKQQAASSLSSQQSPGHEPSLIQLLLPDPRPALLLLPRINTPLTSYNRLPPFFRCLAKQEVELVGAHKSGTH